MPNMVVNAKVRNPNKSSSRIAGVSGETSKDPNLAEGGTSSLIDEGISFSNTPDNSNISLNRQATRTLKRKATGIRELDRPL